jgi:hypothetical protein
VSQREQHHVAAHLPLHTPQEVKKHLFDGLPQAACTAYKKKSTEGFYNAMPQQAAKAESVRNGTNPLSDRTFIEQDPFFSPLLNRDIKFFDPTRGFDSIGSTLRFRRAENTRAHILRLDFLEDFDIDLLEFDEDEAIDEPDADFEDDY